MSDYFGYPTQATQEKAPQMTDHSQELERMMSVRDVFQAAADAIVNVSRLKEEVEHIKAELQQVRSELTEYRERNHWLDKQLTEVRQQRDDYAMQLAVAKQEKEQIERQHATLETAHVSAQNEHNAAVHAYETEMATLKSRVAELIKERDDAHFRELESEERLSALRSKLEAVTKALGLPEPREEKGGEVASFPTPEQKEVPHWMRPRNEAGEFLSPSGQTAGGGDPGSEPEAPKTAQSW